MACCQTERAQKHKTSPFQNLLDFFLPIEFLLYWKGNFLKWRRYVKSNTKRHVLTEICTSSSCILGPSPMKWDQIFSNEHLQLDNFLRNTMTTLWLVLAEQQLTESLTVKFSVMMAFRYRERYQTTCKTTKNSNVIIFFRETNWEALWTNVN